MIDLVKNHREALVHLCQQYNVRRLELCGSALAENTFDPRTSDIDFLVEFLRLEPRQHAKSYFGLLEKLQDMFGRHIDLVEIKAITNPYLLDSINKNRTPIYAT
jgi:predicted nucleotidyltransferase